MPKNDLVMLPISVSSVVFMAVSYVTGISSVKIGRFAAGRRSQRRSKPIGNLRQSACSAVIALGLISDGPLRFAQACERGGLPIFASTVPGLSGNGDEAVFLPPGVLYRLWSNSVKLVSTSYA